MSSNAFHSNPSSAPAADKSNQIEDLLGTDAALDVEALKAAQRTEAGAAPTQTAKRPAPKVVKKVSKVATRSATKASALLAEPTQTIDDAIAAGMPPRALDALLKTWSAYNLQQAQLKAKADTVALANAIQDRRRTIADALLKYADGYGVSMAEARNIFAEAMDAKRSGKLR